MKNKISREIELKLAKLAALEAGGVDNWEGYDFALEDWYKESAEQEIAVDFIDDLNEILFDADIEEPAGRGAGYSIHFDEDAVINLFLDKLQQAKGVK